jgi:hypothetical protein
MKSSLSQLKLIVSQANFTLSLLITLGLMSGSILSEKAIANDVLRSSLVVVASDDFKISQLTKSEVEDIFLQKRVHGLDQQTFVPVFLPDHSHAAVEFADSVLGKSVKQLRAYWNLKVLTGRLKPPVVMNTPEEVITFLSKNRGSLGYLSEPFAKDGLKVLYREVESK